MRPSTSYTFATTFPAALALLLAPAAFAQPAGFGDYWYQGEAEVTSYELEQARYGEVHPGEAVMIFVTEDFSRSKQVKLDDPGAAGDDAVKVLKLNAIRKFYTGVYPYSMMTSVFTPVAPTGSLPRTLKVTTSSQEWCGHTFTQKNRTGDGWRVALFSYFESEGDRTVELPGAIPEDELWTLVRLAPEELPTGEVSLIPGTVFQRLRHLSWEVHRATARLEPAEEEGLMAYTVDYRDLDRELTILFRRDFPHEIEGFEERTPSGFGRGAETLTTRARKKARILLDYWRHNGVDDGHYREQLGLK